MASITIHTDTDPRNPRKEADHMGRMIAFHTRYNLGDDDHGFKSSDYGSWDELERAIVATHKNGVILPLFLYDHSGITMNTTGFLCPWDSGRVGFIVASAAVIREWYGVKRVTAKLRERVKASLIAEVEEYDAYLTGEVYGYELTHDNGYTESCWGFYGSDPFKNGISDNIPEQFHDLLRNAA